MSQVNPDVLSSFPILLPGSDLEVTAITDETEAPEDAPKVEFVCGDENIISRREGYKDASIVDMPGPGRLQINGYYYLRLFGESNADLTVSTSEAMTLANSEGAGWVVIEYARGIPGMPVDHIAQILEGIRFYSIAPSTDPDSTIRTIEPDELENRIRGVTLVLHEGAARVWQERFAPHAGGPDLWLVASCYDWLHKTLVDETGYKCDMKVIDDVEIEPEKIPPMLEHLKGLSIPEFDSLPLALQFVVTSRVLKWFVLNYLPESDPS